ncbi:MAG: class I SAM-dependent methyltransferase [Planctomycetes bacterium]|nr:class I SAM-dependent methyltransferase [Planctomycetota bacterium]
MRILEHDIASYHNVRHTYDPSRSMIWREICRHLQRYVREDGAVLDLGAGYGDFSRHIRAGTKYGLEQNGSLVRHWSDDVQPLIQSALDPFPLEDAVVDTVFASNFFEHFLLDDSCRILSEVERVLRPGGLFIAIQPNIRLEPGRYYDDYTHKTAFTEVSFSDFLASLGWRVRACEGRFLPLTMKSRLPKWGWLARLYLSLPFRPWAGQFLVVAETPANA